MYSENITKTSDVDHRQSTDRASGIRRGVIQGEREGGGSERRCTRRSKPDEKKTTGRMKTWGIECSPELRLSLQEKTVKVRGNRYTSVLRGFVSRIRNDGTILFKTDESGSCLLGRIIRKGIFEWEVLWANS